jgi:hypothetical protein
MYGTDINGIIGKITARPGLNPNIGAMPGVPNIGGRPAVPNIGDVKAQEIIAKIIKLVSQHPEIQRIEGHLNVKFAGYTGPVRVPVNIVK